MRAREWILGIDFGTSNTAAAHTSPISGAVEALTLSHNRTTMSSAVFVESPDHISVGDVATDRAESNPAAYIPSPKRAIGQGVVTVNGYTISSSVPVAAVLESVIARATSTHDGAAPSELVLTHPEAWSPREIQVLLDAAAQLGLNSSTVTTVSEPRAAAHYYSRAHSLTPGTKIAVFDFGGGTLDIAVLEANEHDTFDIIAARGDNGLGGKNLDAHIRRWVDRQLDDRDPDLLNFLRTRAPLDVRYALDDSIRRAKELLSEAPSATISVTGDGRTEKFQITRDEFEELIAPVLDKAVTLARLTLTDANITDPSQLESLYLTGGSSRIPLVHDRLAGLGPIATLDDPKTVVAQGALAAAAPIVRGLGRSPAPTGSPHPSTRTFPPANPAQSAPRPGGEEYPNPAPPQQQASPSYAHPAQQNNTSPTGAPMQQWPQPAGTAPGYAATANAPQPGDRQPGSRRKLLLAGAAAAVLVIAVAGGTLAWNQGSVGSTVTAAATGAEPAAASGGDGATAPPATKEAVLAALPPALKTELDVEKCTASGETDNGGLRIQCIIREGSPLTAGIVTDARSGVIVSVDVRDAKKEVLALRQGYQNNTAVDENVVVENVARTAAAHLSGPKYANQYDINYANGSTGVMVFYTGAVGLDGAKTFLNRAGLIN
ncbi:Hsp70 family protein [Rhodococcus sp. 1168]|uniref:Hsp70 family protein n=1 Tax=Rhodococcus sp. 1168 TaxID=2018041 RepID=UPI000A0E5EC0|nr:Hsp70 family protein [Rhodococcus sp. 1168]ORI26012.1 hypothetical protein BJI47_01000 [Rhodococcus sp. 1168]